MSDEAPLARPVAVAVLALVVAAVVLACFQIQETDLFWHLRTGDEIARNLQIPAHDTYTYTVEGGYYAYYSWAWEVLAAFIYRLGGFELLVLGKAIWYGLTFSALALAARARGARGMALAWGLLFGLLLLRFRMQVRPEMMSFMMLVVFDGLAAHYLRSGRRALLVPLPILALLWGNLHPFVIAGIGVLAVRALGEVCGRRLRLSSAGGTGSPQLLAGVTAASFAATLVNPYGIWIYAPALKLVFSPGIAGAPTREWLPPSADAHLAFFVLAGLASLLLLATARRARLQDHLLFFGTLGLALGSLRNIGVFAVLATPIVAVQLSYALAWVEPRLPAASRSWRPFASPMGLVVFLCTLTLATATLLSPRASVLHIDESQRYRPGLGLSAGAAPADAVDFIERHQLEGPIYNSWALGGYLIWRSWPRLRVFIDGRQMVFEDFLVWTQARTPRDVLDELGVRLALVRYSDREFLETLARGSDFELVFFDDVAMVFARADVVARTAKLESYRLLEPHDLAAASTARASLEALGAVRAEAERAAAQVPRSSRAAMLVGVLARRANELAASEVAFRRAIALDPTQATAHDALGRVLLEQRRVVEALAEFETAIALDPRPYPFHYNAALALAALGQLDDARDALLAAERRAGDAEAVQLIRQQLERLR